MSRKIANELSVVGQRSCPQGGLGACPQQVKKGPRPGLRRSFFGDIDINVHTCLTKMTKKLAKLPRNNQGEKSATNI